MNLWQHVSRRWRRGANARQEVSAAYQALFDGHGGEKEAQIVLADFANWTGFYKVSGPGLSAEDRAFADGMRAAYGRLHRFLRMTDDERRSLEEAARAEALADHEEGPI